MKLKIDKVLIFMILVYFASCLIDSYIYLYNSAIGFPAEFTAYSFWQHSRYGNFNINFTFCLPAIIATGCVFRFNQRLKLGHFRNSLSVIPYKIYMLKEFLKSHLKSLFIVPFISIVILGIGIFLYGIDGPKNLDNIEEYIYANFSFAKLTTHYVLYTFKLTLCTIIYSSIMVNLTIIIMRYVNKFYLTICTLIGTSFIIDFVCSYIVPKIFKCSEMSLMSLYSVNNNFLLGTSVKVGLIIVLITTIIIAIIYKDKERLILEDVK